jgi:hypothetical protein
LKKSDYQKVGHVVGLQGMSLESQRNPIFQKVGHVVRLIGMSLESQRNPIFQKVGHVVGLTGKYPSIYYSKIK